MAIYNLQRGASKTATGELQITGSTADAASIQRRAGASEQWVEVTRASWGAGGTTGTPDAPVAGCTLTLGSGPVNGHVFDGTATYTTSETPAGYYTSATETPPAGISEWDAADSGGAR